VTRRSLVLLFCLALAVSACGPTGLRFAVQEAVVRDPHSALAAADAAFQRWLEDVPHDVAEGARCYLEARPAEGREGDHHVEPEAWCGPVLTLDNELSRPWTVMALSTEPDAGGRLLIAPSGDPVAAHRDPGPLLRADGASAPREAISLSYPDPPPLAEDHFGRVDPALDAPSTRPAATGTFAFRSSTPSAARLELRSWIAPEFGEGRTRTLAPEGHELVLLDLEQAGSFTHGSAEVALHVDDQQLDVAGAGLGTGQIIAVVPNGSSVELRARQDDVDQSLDLRTGELSRDARATAALQRRNSNVRLDLELAATWTQRHVVSDPYFGSWSYDGVSYGLTASCSRASTALFDASRWAPDGHQIVTVECERIETDYGGELRKDAVEASGSLHVSGQAIGPTDVRIARSNRYGWSHDEVSATYVFHVPLGAEHASFVFEGHAYIDDWDLEAGVRSFSPAASSDLPLG
jgi:hypothetical protein